MSYQEIQHRSADSASTRRCALVLVAISLSGTAFAFCVRGSAASSSVTAKYQQLADEASRRQDPVTARLCYERLLREAPGDLGAAFHLALCYDTLGQQEACDVMIAQLAALPGGGYSPAHLFAAERLLNARSPTEAERARAESHLRSVLRQDPGHPEANLLLSMLKNRAGRDLASPRQ